MTDPDIRPVALVTGAQRGIGRATAVMLAQEGFNIAANDLEAGEDLAETARLVEAEGGRAVTIAADISDLASHDALLDQVADAFGRHDCLVNNAGVQVKVRGDLLDVTPESWDRCLDINTRGTFFLTQAFAKRLAAAPPAADGIHRSIVTVSSINAIAASINRGEYCVSKAGLSMMTRLFAIRLAELGVGVYEIRPGVISTDMTAPAKEAYDQRIAEGLSPIKRWGQPEDIARAITTAALGLLPFTVGQPLHIDGGLGVLRF
jgi:NAD(P)-dependent dehydrogenase (short-subunit alcohol dehydrogenase family)